MHVVITSSVVDEVFPILLRQHYSSVTTRMEGKWNCTHLNGLFCHAFCEALRHESFQRNLGESKLGGYKATYRPDMMDHLHFPTPVLLTANPFAGQLDFSHYIMLRRRSFGSSRDPDQEEPGVLPAHSHLLTNPAGTSSQCPPATHLAPTASLAHRPPKRLRLSGMALGMILLKANSSRMEMGSPSPALSSPKGCYPVG